MTRSILAVAVAAIAMPGIASAHAFLDHAVPAVGATIMASPAELDLIFTEAVVPALSGVRVTSVAGAAVAAGKASADAGNPAALHVRLARPLAPGGYVVHWHVVATDTHPTSGTYRFTVAP